MQFFFCLCGSIFGFLSVALGAFGAHALRAKLSSDMLSIFEVGVRYQMYHALALFAVAWAITNYNSGFMLSAGWLFIAGTIIFSGSLYILALTGIKMWGAVTPIGGLLLLLGWLVLIIGIAWTNAASS